jgi:uncharacterized DUF497 family protein
MSLEFEWDEEKGRSNNKKLRVTFAEASTAFDDPMALDAFDEEHSTDEDRYVLIGESDRCRLLVVSFTEGEDRYRIISARVANRREKEQYEEAE